MPIKSLVEGYLKFKKNAFDLREEEFVKLINNGQKPNALFVSCSDSRVVPELITQCDPGGLFHLRHVGNFIPPYNDEPDGIHTSTLATVEFAVNALKIQDIIICGHSNCGACAGLYEDFSDKPELKHLQAWLKQSPKLESFIKRQQDSGLQQENLFEVTERFSLLCQVENLLTYPMIHEKVASKELFLHAWYYDIANGNIDFFDTAELNFQKLDLLIKKT